MFLQIKVSPDRYPGKRMPLIHEQSDNYHTLRNSDNSIEVTLKKRSYYPATYCYQVDKDRFVFGYGTDPSSANARDEYLQIQLDDRGDLKIVRDVLCTLPLYYAYEDGIFLLSNQFEAVANTLPRLTTSNHKLVNALAPSSFCYDMLWNEVKALFDREILEISGGKLSVHLPPSRPWRVTDEAPRSDAKEFFERLEIKFEDTLARYARSIPFAFEVSGGLDSATLPLYVADRYPEVPWFSGSIIVTGDQAHNQKRKLQEIVQRAPNSQFMSVGLDDPRYETLRSTLHEKPHLFSPYEPDHKNAITAMAEAFQQVGCKVVFHGIGGDDLFESTSNIEKHLGFGRAGLIARLEGFTPQFLTNKFIALMAEAIPKQSSRPIPLLSAMTVGPKEGANIYIERDIWPVSPFLDAELYTYCQGLSRRLLQGKKIMRAYHQTKKFPKSIYSDQFKNEDFLEAFNTTVLSDKFAELLEAYAEKAVTEDLGLINAS